MPGGPTHIDDDDDDDVTSLRPTYATDPGVYTKRRLHAGEEWVRLAFPTLHRRIIEPIVDPWDEETIVSPNNICTFYTQHRVPMVSPISSYAMSWVTTHTFLFILFSPNRNLLST